jgi:hypothetical protein
VTPLSNRGMGYTANALFERAGELERLSFELHGASVRCEWLNLGESHAAGFAWRVRQLATELEETANALRRAAETLAPAEALREHVLRDGALIPIAAVFGGAHWVWRQIESGRAWILIRPLAEAALSRMKPVAPASHDIALSVQSAGPVSAPQTLEDRVSRIPSGDTHIRIERFGDRVELYLSGTNFTGGTDDPWNAVSNVELARTTSAASLIAVTEALAAVGVTSATPLVVTGHSQGGLIALALADSGRFRLEGVITVGTPAGIVGDTPGIPTIHLIHPNDPIPPLGGLVAQTSTTWIIESENRGALFDVHHNSAYVSSARQVDELNDPEIVRLFERVGSAGRGLRSDVQAITVLNRP